MYENSTILPKEVVKTFNKRLITKFFIISTIIFWILLILTGLLMLAGLPNFLITIMKNLSAWAPTFSILILIKKIAPEKSFWEYIKESFHPKLKIRPLLLSMILQGSILFLGILIYSKFTFANNQTIALIPISAALLNFIILLTSGPLGEELGWRKYALNELQLKYSPLKSSLILGILWGIWHLPLWFLSGYTGLDLIAYILCFIGGIIATSILITYFYNRSKNLTNAIWIHFWFNYFLNLLSVSSIIFLEIFLYIAILYVICAIVIILFNQNEFREKNGKK